MMQTESRSIGTAEYEVTQLPAGRGRKLLLRLLRAVGPALGSLASAADDQAQVGAAIGALATSLTEEDMEAAVREFSTTTKVRIEGGKPVTLADVIDLHFAGRYGEMVRWLGFALEVNYRSFFSELGGLVGARQSPKVPSPSPTE